MNWILANIQNRIAQHTLAFRLACLLAFIAMLISWSDRPLVTNVIRRLYSSKSKPTIIFAIGNPSTDKDTFIANLAHDFGFQQVIVGPWLTSLRDREDEVGRLARKHWEKQIPMPANHLVPLLRAHLNELRDTIGANRFLIDGFPRNRESAEFWDRKLGRHDLTIYFETPERRASAQYAGVVRKRFDSVSGEDERKLVKQRFEEHENETEGLLEYLRSMRLLILC